MPGSWSHAILDIGASKKMEPCIGLKGGDDALLLGPLRQMGVTERTLVPLMVFGGDWRVSACLSTFNWRGVNVNVRVVFLLEDWVASRFPRSELASPTSPSDPCDCDGDVPVSEFMVNSVPSLRVECDL
jgi:hypothetical protein